MTRGLGLTFLFLTLYILPMVSCVKQSTRQTTETQQNQIQSSSSGSGSTSTTTTTTGGTGGFTSTTTGGSSSSTSGSTTTGGGSGSGGGSGNPNGYPDCAVAPGINDNNQSSNYNSYEIIALGRGNLPGLESYPSWSNLLFPNHTNISPAFIPDNVRSDARFNVRIVPLEKPGLVANCPFGNEVYSKLSMKVGLRHPNAAVGQFGQGSVAVINNINVNSCSNKFSLTVPGNLNGEIPALEVFEMKWDRCNNGWSAPNPESPCEMNLVWNQNCVKFLLQWSTDYTWDLPN